MDNENAALLKFIPLRSFVHNDFWHKYVDIKLDIDRLDASRRKIFGFISLAKQTLAQIEVDCTSFNSTRSYDPNRVICNGHIHNYNTIESFKQCNKKTLLKEQAVQFYHHLMQQKCINNSTDLLQFFMISFSDLKSYKFYYWFAFPVPSDLVYLCETAYALPKSMEDHLSFCIEKRWNLSSLHREPSELFFIYHRSIDIRLLSEYVCHTNIEANFCDVDLEDISFCFYDAANNSCDMTVSWHVRQLLVYITLTCPSLSEKIISLIKISKNTTGEFQFSDIRIKVPQHIENINQIDNWVGWEVNEAHRYVPRFVSLAESMSPKCLAENAINLNLKLMKWRLVPELDLTSIQRTKCLLLGSGTLGCNVARSLMAWGVNTITFVDCGQVSMSNPVRQSLYRYEDALNGGKPKASTAAARLREINPAINTQGEDIRIPMPGHPVTEAAAVEETKSCLAKLTTLIEKHDVVFLLTDSRESRWLPTMLAAFYGKLAINAALGFDSFMVIRHGYGSSNNDTDCKTDVLENGFKRVDGANLGCYFCNDIVAPGNSLKDRTLDQQCTVTRPAVSNTAAGLAVELMVSLIQHPLRFSAPAYYRTPRSDPNKIGQEPEGILGVLPHSIRGNIAAQQYMLTATERYKHCVACSTIVLDHYASKKEAFIIDVLNAHKTLEEIVGIDYSKAITEENQKDPIEFESDFSDDS
ncbi:uncharacterized protein LOC128275615 [Anopheles cruzii]|uniref:uncharacterized protein LOC128275615 n=1 Tax=Anopheles cruzii TaxID=68878 RepID=UPI0022EC1A9D|nr:uncharacterized protein LOC128275615 [Anopheles cruzii]